MMTDIELAGEYKGILGDTLFWNCVSIENARNGFLWCSINPGEVKGGERFNDCWENMRDIGRSKYWMTLKRKIGTRLNRFGHIDLFPIHCSDEIDFLSTYRGKEETPEFKKFVALLKVTQEFIENLCPRLIVYSNASTSYLWGWPKQDWMGYILEPVLLPFSITSGRISKHSQDSLFRITGINDSKQVIKEIKTTALKDIGTYILLDNQNDNHFQHPEISPEDLDSIIKFLNL